MNQRTSHQNEKSNNVALRRRDHENTKEKLDMCKNHLFRLKKHIKFLFQVPDFNPFILGICNNCVLFAGSNSRLNISNIFAVVYYMSCTHVTIVEISIKVNKNYNISQNMLSLFKSPDKYLLR